MAREIWLRTNARALLFGMVPPALVALTGALLILASTRRESPGWLGTGGAAIAILGLLLVAGLAWQLRKPRLACDAGYLLVALRMGTTFRVPIGFVEGFLLGQAPSLLPGKRHRHTETATLLVRIADRAVDWHRREVEPRLGKWCEGYITIRGTWCEPLSIELVNRLNERLAEVRRAAPRQ